MKFYEAAQGEMCSAKIVPRAQMNVRFKKTGEIRNPKRGEWYLSGAIPQAWLAPNDLGSKFHILEPV